MDTSARPTDGSVADVMRRRFVTASPDDAPADVRQTMRLARLRHLVIARRGLLVGLLSYRKLLEQLLEGRASEVAVASAMVASPTFVTPVTPLAEAAARLCHSGFGCLPVVESPEYLRLVGLVTETDLLRAIFGA